MDSKQLLSAININNFSNDEQKLIHSYIDNEAEIERVKLDLMTSRMASHSAASSGLEYTEIELSIEQLTNKLASLKKTGDDFYNSLTALIESESKKRSFNSFNNNSGSSNTYEFSTDQRKPEEINAKQIKIYEGIVIKGNSVLVSARKNLKKMEEDLALLQAKKISLATSINNNKAYVEAEQKCHSQQILVDKQRILIGDILDSIKESETKIQSLKTIGELDAL